MCAICLASTETVESGLNMSVITRIETELAEFERVHPDRKAAPYAVNLIVNKANRRLDADLEVVLAHKAPIVITSLSAPTAIVPRVHAYGGLVFHDVIKVRHAEKALEAGVDGLIAVCAGAGGHAGTLNPLSPSCTVIKGSSRSRANAVAFSVDASEYEPIPSDRWRPVVA